MLLGYQSLKTIEDWIPIVGSKNWQQGHSAFELAHKWHPGKRFPDRVREAFSACTDPRLRRLDINYCCVEKPVFLDTYKAPSWTDLMAYCRVRDNETALVGVEGKAKEPFDEIVRTWTRDGGESPKPSRTKRLNFLGNAIGKPIDPDSGLRYQLVHRTASILLEARLQGAAFCVLLVHSFCEGNGSNWADYQRFVEHLGIREPKKNLAQGPLWLGPQQETAMFVCWVSDNPKENLEQPG